MHNGKYQCYMAARCTYHPTNYHPLAAWQEPYKNAFIYMNNIWEYYGECKSQENRQLAENDKTKSKSNSIGDKNR